MNPGLKQFRSAFGQTPKPLNPGLLVLFLGLSEKTTHFTGQLRRQPQGSPTVIHYLLAGLFRGHPHGKQTAIFRFLGIDSRCLFGYDFIENAH
jgi:hypothetical protein